MRAAILASLVCFAAPVAAAQDFALEAAAGADLRSMCEADGGRLWGASLCGPLLIADPGTRRLWASQPDAEGALRFNGAGWAGVLPPGIPIANTAVDWSGVRWTMLAGPLPGAPVDRRVLLAHEAWHRIQASIGLAPQSSDCSHLESERGRYLLRLELRALAVALRSSGGARRRAAQHALAFRSARLAEFAAAAAGEASLDRNEGLASYTGVKLGAGDAAEAYAARTLDQFDAHGAYARAYAYASGPAYGLLLDDYGGRDWRAGLGAYAPADLLAMAVRARPLSAARLHEAAGRYGGPAIAAEERARVEAQRARLAELRRRFGEGPRLVLPLSVFQMEFDPNQVTPVDGLGSYYAVLTLRDVWGEVRASEGALISSDFQQAVLPEPDGTGLAGPGWRLDLAPGYLPSPGDAAGRRTIELTAQQP
jgi:hypothetical protein